MNTTTIHISNIIDSQRIDVSYFKETSGTDRFVPLSKYVEVKGGKRIPKGESFSFENTNYLYLRLSEITDPYNIDYTALKNISEDLFNTLHRYEITNNQVVFSIAGTIGRVFTIKNIPQGKRVILTENCAKLQPKDGKILPDFISILLGCDFVQQQIGQNRIKTTIPKIGLDRIAKLKVPELPSLKKQQEIVDIYSNTQKERLKKKREAEQLLDGIDDYLLDSLKINNTLDSEIGSSFNIPFSRIINNRLDVSFYKNKFEMISTVYRNEKLSSIVEIDPTISFKEREADEIISFIPMESIDEEYGEIAYSHETIVAESKGYTKFEDGDLLWAKITPCMQNGKSAIARGLKHGVGCGSTEFFVLRPQNINDVLIDYVYLILRHHKVLESAQSSFGGSAGQQRVSKQYLKNLMIPLPDASIQKEMVDKVVSMKTKAKCLQKEGNRLMEDTKRKIENMILG